MSETSAKQRGGIRSAATAERSKAVSMLNGTTPLDAGALKISHKKLEKYLKRLEDADAKVQDALSGNSLDSDITDAEKYNDSIMTTLGEIENHFDEQATAAVQQSAPVSQVVAPSAADSSSLPFFKLPKFEMTPFDGDPVNWQPFWDVYKVAIHENAKLAAIEKFSYLMGYLDGDAYNVVKGFSLTEANYTNVIKTLHERFANKNRAQFSHIQAMINIEPVKGPSLSELHRVRNEYEANIRSLDALDMKEDTFGLVFVSVIMTKLPKYLTKIICEKTGQNDFELSKIREWVKNDIAAREMSDSTFGNDGKSAGSKNQDYQPNHGGSNYGRPQTTTSSLPAPGDARSFGRRPQQAVKPPPRCHLCDQPHFTDKCQQYPTSESRYAQLTKRLGSRFCQVCLYTDHPKSECRFGSKPCYHCGQPGHHVSLCGKRFGNYGPSQRSSGWSSNDNSGWSNSSQSSSNGGAAGSHAHTGTEGKKQPTPAKVSTAIAVAQHGECTDVDVSYLQTAVITATSESRDKSATGRVLMDSASSRTYVTESFCKKLGLKSIGSTYISVGRFGSNRRQNMEVNRVMFTILCRDGCLQPVLANVTPIISCPVSRHPIDLELCPLAEDMDLGEPLSHTIDSLDIDVLIGSDQYFNFVLTSGTIGHPSGLVFVPSRVGYLTTGTLPIEKEENGFPESTLVLYCPETQQSDSIILPHECCDIEKFWKLEDVGTKESKVDDIADVEALRQFNETVKFHDGRYHVTWPWKSKDPELPNNFGLALGRLRSTLRRLGDNEDLLKEYDSIIRTQLEKGIIEKAPEKPDGTVYYVSHHAVIKPEKTTKVRVVYDASAKVRKDLPSLNDCLLRGPVVMENLCGLIMRSRLNIVAVVSDIEKAFHQVRLQTHERDVTRFLWVNDPTKPPTEDNLVLFRFTSVLFGAISSPFLLAATIDNHLRRSEGEVARKIRESTYVDNIIAGEDSNQKAIEHYREAKRLFLGASMNLREFYTNSPVVRESFASDDRGKSDTPKILGIRWNTDDDTFHCSGLKLAEKSGPLTKRVLASEVAKIYDPCGWFCPVVVPGKLLVQETWKENLGWDETPPSDMAARWPKIRDELSKISEIGIPRYVGFSTSAKLELHAFCDASTVACGVSVYLRKEGADGTACNLVFAKTNLAPLKPRPTIPCLELNAIVMGAHLIDFVAEQLRLVLNQKVVWSDSQSVLCWLRKEKLATKFAERRVSQARQKKDVVFRFVPGKQNPADLPTRGCTVDDLSQNKAWWHGPSWLCPSSNHWPKDQTSTVSDVASPQPVTQLAVVETAKRVSIFDPQKFSTLQRVLRVTAYVQRFAHNIRVNTSERQVGSLTVREVSDARTYWEKLAQYQGYPTLRVELTHTLTRRSSVSQLNIFRDSKGLLRCSGRLQHSHLSYDAQNPILLPKNHPFTFRVIHHAHLRNMHAGVTQTLNDVRQRYWIPHGRSQVKCVIRSCQTCRRVEGGPYQIPAAPALPEFRVVEQEPFASTGMDYLGFLNVKVEPRKTQKVWICLYTCAVSRAIHLELVENQSAEEFHLALRRFIATYGSPKLIVSDNASQFITVESAMKKLWCELTSSNEIEDLATSNQITWKKIPQLAPWMGGFFERLVGVVKKHLKKVLDGITLSMSELRTVLVEIAAIVNSRPLLYVEDDLNSSQLSPADLLGKLRRDPLPTFSENGLETIPTSKNVVEVIVSRWKRLQSVTSTFWSEWRQSYLTSLRERHANASQRNPSMLLPTVGSVVQVKDKMPRAQWRLGKIQKLFSSADGQVRSVQLRLSNGRMITRPIKLLYPLEMHVEAPESQSDNSQPSTEAIPNPITPYSAPVDLDEGSEDDFLGFDSQDVVEVADQIEKYDKFEKMLGALPLPYSDSDNAASRPRREKAIQARQNIRKCVKKCRLWREGSSE